MRFPELSQALTQIGAEILTYPSAFTVPTGMAHWEVGKHVLYICDWSQVKGPRANFMWLKNLLNSEQYLLSITVN